MPVVGMSAAGVQPRATHPLLVAVAALEDRTPQLVERMLARVAQVLVGELAAGRV